jgi:type II secretory pathway pseudopilin PulG
MQDFSKSNGYTIIEVMIFLAVSGFMFVIAAAFISGKQATAEFNQSVSNVNTQVEQAIADVGDGTYPSENNFTCTVPGSPGQQMSFPASASSQGTNKDCVFFGKAIQFGLRGSSNAPTDGTQYAVYSIAAAQFSGCTTLYNTLPPSDYADACPTVIRDTSSNVDLTQIDGLQYGMSATAMYDYNASTDSINDISGIAFTTNFAHSDVSGNLVSGSQNINAVAITDSPSIDSGHGENEANMVTNINNDMEHADSTTYLRPSAYFVVCFKGTTNQYATLTIGGATGERLTTSTQISSSPIDISFPNRTQDCPS